MIATIVCAVFLTVGSLLVVAGVGALGATGMMRGDRGLYNGDTTSWSTPGYAVRPTEVYLHGWPMMGTRHLVGDVEVTAISTTSENVFVGLARTSDVDRYLADGVPAVAPTASPIWVASASGPGAQTLTWPASSGRWSLVVMNADGSRHVAADVRVSAELPVLATASGAVFVTGVVLLVAAAIGLVVAVPRTRQPTTNQE